jgi:hypothetical protein
MRVMHNKKCDGAKIPMEYGLLRDRISRRNRAHDIVRRNVRARSRAKSGDRERISAVEKNFAAEAAAGASSDRFERKSRESVPTDSRRRPFQQPQTSVRGVARSKRFGSIALESATITVVAGRTRVR